MCSHDPIFGTNKNRIRKNGSCERAFRVIIFNRAHILRTLFNIQSGEGFCLDGA